MGSHPVNRRHPIAAGPGALERLIRCTKPMQLTSWQRTLQSGHTQVKGPVRTDEEKAAIEAKAVQVAGQDNVTSLIEIVPKKT